MKSYGTISKRLFIGFTLFLAAFYIWIGWESSGSVSEGKKTNVRQVFAENALRVKSPSPMAEALPLSLEETLETDTLLSLPMRELAGWLEAGRPVRLRVGDGTAADFAFRPTRVTADSFLISSSPTEAYSAAWRVYDGRELLPNGRLGGTASLAIVNDAVSVAVEQGGRRYLIETDASSGTLYATYLDGAESGHDECEALACSHKYGNPLAGVRAPDSMPAVNERKVDASIEYPGDEPMEPLTEAAWVDHPYFRLAPRYDASLKDILVLMVSGSTQTGSSANLSSRAASYLTYAARVADTYERQLGLRYLLQELVLIANDSGQDDIEYDDSVTPNDPAEGTDDLGALEDWCNKHRPQAIYGWGHAAGWTLVEGSGGGTIGWAWVDSYGSSGSAFSVQERNYDWDVHSHELGHNVGASHTQGGVMNGSLRNNNEDFFTENLANGGYTAAMDIYNYMSSSSRNFVFGPALLRHAEEIPFAVDDAVYTPINTEVSFDPLANDETSVLFGATNTLRLVEVGQVFPKSAGTASVVGEWIRFTPAAGFNGNAWFTYTISGDVGNGGLGWLHAADVVVTVGADATDPSQSPLISLTNDTIETDFSAAVRFQPLLNDEGAGRLWAGDVDVLSQINGTAEAYSDQAFHLVSARVLSGNGSVELETRSMTRDASSSTGNTGYILYQPDVDELDTVLIEYTVEDAAGNQSTAIATLNRVATVTVVSDVSQLIEHEGRVATLTFSRSGNADTILPELVEFSLAGDATLVGAGADVALAGFTYLDIGTMSGAVEIPAGQFSAIIQVVGTDDEMDEGNEWLRVSITATESLLVDANDNQVTLTIADTGSSSEVIFVEDFDAFSEPSGIGNGAGSDWINASEGTSNDSNWEVQSGETPSNNTGPLGDYGSGSGHYLYIVASGTTGKAAELLSPSLDLSGQSTAALEFAYHMYGSDMGELHVDVRVLGGDWTLDVLPVLLGEQSVDESDWRVASLDLTPFISTATQIRFRGLTGSGFRSDICIDDFRVRGALPAQSPVILSQPIGSTLDLLDPLYLTVIAEANPAPTYQWKRNGEAIPGATKPAYYVAAADTSDAGYYTVEVTRGNTVVSLTANVSVGSVTVLAYDQTWKDRAFGVGESGASTEPLADFNGDGRLNIIDYAFQIETMTPSDVMGKLPSLQLTPEGGESYAEIILRRIAGGTGNLVEASGYAAGGIVYIVECSADLSEIRWQTGSTVLEQVGAPLDNGDGTETVVVRLKTAQAATANPQHFMRVRISLEAP